MNTLKNLSSLIRELLSNPPPKAVLTTLRWVASRCHPAVAALIVVVVAYAWKPLGDLLAACSASAGESG